MTTTVVPRMPPASRLPRAVQALAFVISRRRFLSVLRGRFGPAFVVELPFFGTSVFVADPALIKQLFQADANTVGPPEPNLGIVLGPGSTFGLDGDEHRHRRKLLTPPFHGKRMRAYEGIVEEEVLRETRTWPQGKEFPTLDSMMRVTLNAILRAVFGAEGEEFAELRELMPRMVLAGSRIAGLPILRKDWGRASPARRYANFRRQYDAIVARLITKALNDPTLADRTDVLALLLAAHYDNGEPMTHADIADELLTLLAAGHETTATTLSWAIERLRRHPSILARLVAEVDSGGGELLQATILEVQRVRPVVSFAARRTKATLRLGEWVIPAGCTVVGAIPLVHADDEVFPDAARFDPDRFVGHHPGSSSWIPFGGGLRRCIGAAFATMEMTVTLRTLLREFELETTTAPDERSHFRGIAFAPQDKGRAVVRRRQDREAGG